MLAEDRDLYRDIEMMVDLMREGELVREVERAVGEIIAIPDPAGPSCWPPAPA